MPFLPRSSLTSYSRLSLLQNYWEEHWTRKYKRGSVYFWHWLVMGFWKSPWPNPIISHLDYCLPPGPCTSLASLQSGLHTEWDQVTPLNKDQIPKALRPCLVQLLWILSLHLAFFSPSLLVTLACSDSSEALWRFLALEGSSPATLPTTFFLPFT